MEPLSNSNEPNLKSNGDQTLSAILELIRDRYSNVPADRAGVPGMVKETTAWDVYYNEARKVDQELIKSWNSGLSSLMLFAAIFSAVLTSFIGQTAGLLAQDSREVSVQIALWSAHYAANNSIGDFVLPPFDPSATVVAINCLFYGSLVLSLIAVLAGVVATQWVNEYDVKVTRTQPSPLLRAVCHYYRFSAVQKWNMDGIIRSLPFLLYTSVAMFLVGTILYTYAIVNKTVGHVVTTGVVLILYYLFFLTALAAFTDAPFETPLSYLIGMGIRLISLYVHRMAWLLGISLEETQFIKRGAAYIGRTKRDDIIVQSNEQELATRSLEWLISRVNILPDLHKRQSILLADCTAQLAARDDVSEDFLSHWVKFMHQIGRDQLKKRDIEVTEADVGEVELLRRWFDKQEIRQLFPQYYQTPEDAEVLVEDNDDTNAAILLLRGLPATSAVGIRNKILLSR